MVFYSKVALVRRRRIRRFFKCGIIICGFIHPYSPSKSRIKWSGSPNPIFIHTIPYFFFPSTSIFLILYFLNKHAPPEWRQFSKSCTNITYKSQVTHQLRKNSVLLIKIEIIRNERDNLKWKILLNNRNKESNYITMNLYVLIQPQTYLIFKINYNHNIYVFPIIVIKN